jgi:hypothetical protein
MRVHPTARRTPPIGEHDPGEPLVRQMEAFEDRLRSHDLNVVLMRRNAQMRGSLQRFIYG